jgi:hypothetical protein
MFLEVFIATVAAIFATVLVGKIAKAVFLASHRTAGRLIESVRWPLWCTAVSVILGLTERVPAGTLLWQAPAFFGLGLASCYAYVLAKATYRTARILRARRNPTPS